MLELWCKEISPNTYILIVFVFLVKDYVFVTGLSVCPFIVLSFGFLEVQTLNLFGRKFSLPRFNLFLVLLGFVFQFLQCSVAMLFTPPPPFQGKYNKCPDSKYGECLKSRLFRFWTLFKRLLQMD